MKWSKARTTICSKGKHSLNLSNKASKFLYNLNQKWY
jgi:hypothetical protein